MKNSVLALLCLNWVALSQAQQNTPSTVALPDVRVVATSPVGGTSIALNKFPGNVQVINKAQIPADGTSLPDLLNQSIGSVNLNDTQGNSYVVDLSYRGFTASPVLGTPQGISVFLDGMRMNEAFGDVMSWDLIPQIALDKITLIPGSNPVYGLNTLGGAISMHTRTGFTSPGASVKTTAGTFGRASLDLDYGGHDENTAYYLATSVFNERGWAAHNPSRIRQLFGRLDYRDQKLDLDLSTMYSDNLMYGNQTVPVSMLAQAAQGYSHPDYTAAQSYHVNLRGKYDWSESRSLAGNVYHRHIARDILNSNLNAFIGDPNGSSNDATCASAPESLGCPASNLLAHYTQDSFGANLQGSDSSRVWDRPQVMTVGLNAEYGRTQFFGAGQSGYVSANAAIIGVDPFVTQATVASINKRLGLFATDTLDLSRALSLTASLRYDYAQIDLTGSSCNDLNGDLCDSAAALSGVPGTNTLANVAGAHAYHRLNPALGLTYEFSAALNGFANYSEGFRTPSAIELMCSDPTSPCNGVPNAFSSDPDLKAVISKTYELGFRGALGADLKWRAAAFHSVLSNDILFNQTNATRGYFSNVAKTRRQGLELGLDGKIGRLDYALNASWINASILSSFVIANGSNSQCIAANGVGNGCAGVYVRPGDKMAGLPALTLKLRLGYSITAQSHLGVTLQAQSLQYARGDENNQDVHGPVPGFAVVKLDGTHKLSQGVSLFVGVNNLFNRQYANFGMLSANQLTTGVDEQFRGVGAPRSVYASVAARF